MASFRKRSSLAKTARNVAIADAAWALARDRLATKAPGVKPRRRGPSAKVLVLGGVAVAAGAVAFLKRERVAGLLPSHAETPTPAPPPPAPSNYDAPGPVANTATPVPAPEPQVHPAGLDEAAEEAAAGAEAANIGGGPTEYAGPAGEPAGAAWRPLAESGEGEAEGQEQAEAELTENAILRDAGTTGAEEQLEEAIEQQHNPLAGETAEPVVSEEPPAEAEQRAEDPPAQPAEPPAEPTPSTDQPSSPDQEDTGWKTWSGRGVDS
jgi:hypothetical protein